MRNVLLFLILLLCTHAAQADDETLAPYQPRLGRERPVIAVVAQNRMTELADYVIPLGILRRSGVAQVLALATEPGPVQLMPALRLQPQATLEEFMQRYPQGADYLIVPAVHDSQDPTLLAFIQAQAARDATIVGVCDGVLVLGYAGLLHGRRATGHWYSRSQRLEDFPDTHWEENRRYVADGKVITTSGVTAALPLSLALVAAIAGEPRAATLAREFGVQDWSPRHDSQRFSLGVSGYLIAAANYLAIWNHEVFSVPLKQGFDEVSLALTADAWARTFRTEVRGSAAHPVSSAGGLLFLPDPPDDHPALPGLGATAIPTLDSTLDAIARRYGESTRRLVASQLEYAPPERSDRLARRNNMDNP
ncbi:DJ-1/PfpI family protein [Pseudomonas sp. PDM23]|uniref:DJ-1/PfpI family protein n=1 Tax=unclassified Pseudomonas TaxID=196821 RepID=UPI001780FBF6|nr:MULTISPECIES: DJ-1/PfpI family protein [unclassified Pseudomonas]MBD9576153.1 DJ-1/PfpI family protein [Pseudomonas sp. PDM23]MBD9670080.1 DJ-1/PfpI family protein [Pseudomonas sp. PDM21]